MNVDELYNELDELLEMYDSPGGIGKDDFDRLQALRGWVADIEELAPQARNYGAELIHENDFVKYAQQLADDIHGSDNELSNSWPFNCIDWEQAAHELQQDYTVLEIDGSTYYGREQ